MPFQAFNKNNAFRRLIRIRRIAQNSEEQIPFSFLSLDERFGYRMSRKAEVCRSAVP